MTLAFGSLFAGIGGFDLGFERAGMACAWQVEIDARCRAVLARHWSAVERLEDVREVGAHNLPPVNVITFGSPCQDLSTAGKRVGLKGKRSGLFFEAIRIVDELEPAFAVWENVPGALSSHDGRDFRAVLAAFQECGARDIAWRTLDAQGFGVAQRRRRVFLVADFRGERAGEILFERESLPWDSAAGEEARGQPTGAPAQCFKRRGGFGWSGYGDISPTLEAAERSHEPMNRTPVVVTAFDYGIGGTERTRCVRTSDYAQLLSNRPDAIVVGTLRASGSGTAHVGNGEIEMIVSDMLGPRRLTPVECERLQGFPDDWTAGHSDTARYRMLGNAVCVPVAEWIGQRIVEHS